jgi:hypothetical protein
VRPVEVELGAVNNECSVGTVDCSSGYTPSGGRPA